MCTNIKQRVPDMPGKSAVGETNNTNKNTCKQVGTETLYAHFRKNPAKQAYNHNISKKATGHIHTHTHVP